MKVLHVTKKYPEALGGDAVVVANLETHQLKMGMEVFILTHRCPEIVNKQNVAKFGLNILSCNLDKVTVKRLISLISLPFFGYNYLMKLRPDIIHSHSPDLGFAISLPARLLGIPVINTCHGVSLTNNNISVAKRFMETFFLKHSGFSRIITVDSTSVAALQQRGIAGIVYIPNGVDPEFWAQKENEPREKRSGVTFLFVGRLEEQKGLKYLIEAAKDLKSEEVNFSVLLVGDGSQRHLLEHFVTSNGLGNHVRLLGKVGLEDLRRIYLNSDIFLLPSLWEGMPLTLLEAWASGLPVIITNVGNIPDICVNRENAWIIEPGNETDLYDAMLALGRSRELRDRLGRNGLATVQENYSWKVVAEKTVLLYKKVCKVSV